jgi:hypothetical protein
VIVADAGPTTPERLAREGALPVQQPAYGCVKVAGNSITASPIPCTTEEARWTGSEPKNHGPGAIILQMANGSPLTIMPGQGLRRYPGGVRVQDWDGSEGEGFGVKGPEGCPYVGDGWAMLKNEACRQQKVYGSQPQSPKVSDEMPGPSPWGGPGYLNKPVR